MNNFFYNMFSAFFGVLMTSILMLISESASKDACMPYIVLSYIFVVISAFGVIATSKDDDHLALHRKIYSYSIIRESDDGLKLPDDLKCGLLAVLTILCIVLVLVAFLVVQEVLIRL